MTTKEIAKEIKNADTWDFDLCGELCDRAGLADEWDAADGESFEAVIFKAAEKLGVEVL